MLNKFKIATRVQLSFAALIILGLAVILPVINYKVSEVVYSAEKKELDNLYKSAFAEIKSEGRLAQVMSLIVASEPSINRAMAEGKRDEVAANTIPLFNQLKNQYAVRQFQFHLPPAISFLRVHKPEKFGDDLSSFRKTILAVNSTRQPVAGLEKGVAGLGIRGLNPVYYNGKHIGSVEFGMSFGQPFFDGFKKDFGADIALHILKNDTFVPFASTLGKNIKEKITLLNNKDMIAIMHGSTVIKNSEFSGTPFAVLGKSVLDFSGNPVGVMEIALDRSNYVSALSNIRNITILMAVMALIIGFVVVFYIGRSIVKPISVAVDTMNDIAEGGGDLTKRLNEIGNDEVAQLGKAFNQFAEKVRQIVLQVSSSTSQLATAAEEMSVITNEMNQGVRQQQHETEMVATAMNEMTSTVQEVARHATEASNAAQDADSEAKSGKDVVENTVVSINTLANEVETATQVINQLGRDSENIGTVLDVIRDIAEQTNLLALNAAIEAARAGEQGRGFAVVADEVRTLASRTQQSTEEIQGMIESLQQGARDAVQAMESSQGQSKFSVEQVMNARQTLDAITDAVTTITNMNIQIAGAAKEQSSVAEEINENVVNISRVVEQTADGAQQTQMASDELAQLAHELQDLVGQFKT